MKDLNNLQKLVNAHRRGGRSPFPESLKSQILEAAVVHGKTQVMKTLKVSPSSFYKWSKRSKSKPKEEDPMVTTFVEIPKPSRAITDDTGVSKRPEVQVRWEAVRPDGSILRCELNSQKLEEVGSILNNFLNCGGEQ